MTAQAPPQPENWPEGMMQTTPLPDGTIPKPKPVGYMLRLYVAGNGSRSVHAIANIKAICEQYLKGYYGLEVIDLYQRPERAKDEQIVAIPTLVRELPLPVRRIIGDLSDTAEVCRSLDIGFHPDAGSAPEIV
jgi:circadian clock protein KaiB